MHDIYRYSIIPAFTTKHFSKMNAPFGSEIQNMMIKLYYYVYM